MAVVTVLSDGSCCCAGTSTGCCLFSGEKLYATFGGSLAPLGTVEMPYRGVDSYAGFGAGCGGRSIEIQCLIGTDGLQHYFFSVNSTDPWTITLISCSPFMLTGTTPNSAAPCVGPASVTITE